MFGIPYVFGIAFTDLEEERAWLMVPTLGPWITLTQTDYSCDENSLTDCEEERAGKTLLIFDGLMQVTGTALLIYGFVSPRERLVRQDLYRGLMLTPRFSANGAGLWASGEF